MDYNSFNELSKANAGEVLVTECISPVALLCHHCCVVPTYTIVPQCHHLFPNSEQY